MRLLFCISTWLLFFFESCQLYQPRDPLTKKFNAARLKKDFELFGRILKTAHPSLNSYLTKKRSLFLLDSLSSTIGYSTTLRDFYNKLSFFTNEIGCSHTVVVLPQSIVDTLNNRPLFFPLPVIYIGDRLLVNSDHVLPHGTEIISINNHSAAALADSLSFYNPVDGKHRETQKGMVGSDFGFEYFMRFGGNILFRVAIKDSFGIKRDTILRSITLDQLRNREEDKYYYDATDVAYSMHISDDGKYALLRLTSFSFGSGNSEDAFEDFLKNSFELLSKKPECKNLIIDLRENQGGHLYNSFLLFSYLSRSPFKEFKAVYSKIREIPFNEYLGEGLDQDDIRITNEKLQNEFHPYGGNRNAYEDSLIDEWSPQPTSFTGNVFIITNSNVMSAASYFASLVQQSGRGSVVGTGTSGGVYSGNGFKNLEYKLPYTGIKFIFPYAKIVYPYGTSHTETGLIPDYIVPDTYQSFKENRDTQLVYITAHLVKKNK